MYQSFKDIVTNPVFFSYLDETDSTMNLALRILNNNFSSFDETTYGLVMADAQTCGRGRLNRIWYSSKDNFQGTITVATSTPLLNLNGLSLVVGTLIAETLAHFGAEPCLKWPNDILTLEGKKVGGVLIEVKSYDTLNVLLIGIGLNLNSSPSDLPNSSSVREGWKINLDKVSFARHLLGHLNDELPKFYSFGFPHFKARWLKYLFHKREFSLRIDDSVNKAYFLDVNGKEQEFVSGEIEFLL
jgi:BirA family transcriptional regulator, biotin operon repressor / biotin---[acetyl-CoA-carboxylase] ligase